MAQLLRSSIPFLLAALAAGGAAAGADGPASPASVQACIESNRPKLTSIQTITMQANDRAGHATKTRAKIFWKKFDDDLARVLMRFTDPMDMRGSAVLLIEREDRTKSDIFMYLPELDKVKRVTRHMASGSIFGTDITYEQMERLYGLVDEGSSTLGPDQDVEGRPAWVVEGRPTPDEASSYAKVVVFVDQKTCLPLRMEFYERNDKLRKVMTTDVAKIEQVGSIWVSRAMQMQDLRDQTATDVTVESIEVDVDVPNRYFSQRELETRRRVE